MDLKKDDFNAVKKALTYWKDAAFISTNMFNLLSSDLHLQEKFPVRKVVKLCSIITVLSFLCAITSAVPFFGNFLKHLREHFPQLVAFLESPGGQTLIATLFSVTLYTITFRFRRSLRSIVKGMFNAFNVLFLHNWAFFSFLTYLDVPKENYAFSYAMFSVLSAGVAYLTQSVFIWLIFLLEIGVSAGFFCGYAGGGTYWLYLKDPLLFVSIGLLFIASYQLLRSFKTTKRFSETTLSVGLLYTFLSLWILSIFGNRHCPKEFLATSIGCWTILFLIAALVTLFLGFKFQHITAQKYGVIFFFINTTTKYCEWFWAPLFKPIFFFTLGCFFLLIALKLKNILRFLERVIAPQEAEKPL